MSELAQPPLVCLDTPLISKNPCPCGRLHIFAQKLRKIRRSHLKNPSPPCPQNVRTRQPPLSPLTLDVFYGRTLMIIFQNVVNNALDFRLELKFVLIIRLKLLVCTV